MPLFGKTFDLNGDGRVSMGEELFGYTMMKKIQQEQQKDFDADELDDDFDDSFLKDEIEECFREEAEYHSDWDAYTSDYE